MTDNDPNMALWRFSIISPLLHRSEDDPALLRQFAELGEKSFIRPDGSATQLSAETLRKWLYRYRSGGLNALENQVRKDKGRQEIPKPLADAMARLRLEHPKWTLTKVLEKLLATGLWNGIKPSRATLYRFATANKLLKTPADPENTASRSFAFENFGQLWLADFMHGPRLRDGRGFKKAILHVIIDDATRYVVSARFYFKETVEVLITEMMVAVRRYGICQRFYTDNGPCYASAHLKIVCARLGIHLVHTPPYRPQGRGKIERFFRTVRNQFLGDQIADRIDDLNRDFQQYLTEYHQRIHSSLKLSPLQKRLSGQNACRMLPEVTDIRNLFCMQRRCRVYNDTTIRINSRIFEVPDAVPATTVEVFYLPWDLTWIFYGNLMKPARPLNKTRNAKRFQHPKGGKS
jgi:transposase InsO family protein